MPSSLYPKNLKTFSIFIHLTIILNYGNSKHEQNKNYVVTKISTLIIYHYNLSKSNFKRRD